MKTALVAAEAAAHVLERTAQHMEAASVEKPRLASTPVSPDEGECWNRCVAPEESGQKYVDSAV